MATVNPNLAKGRTRPHRRLLSAGLALGGLVLANGTPAPAADLVGYEQLHAFYRTAGDGEYLYDSVIEGKDGRLYGTALNGGPEDGGLVFALNKDGTGYVILHNFGRGDTNGLSPWGTVIQGSDHRLYGATRHGGAFDAGVVFSITTNGTDFTIVRSFTTNQNDGDYPLNNVIEGSDGWLYGRTSSGGTNDGNSIFRLDRNGTGYRLLHSFNADLQFDGDSYSGLIEGSDGMLYGTTFREGALGKGSVFRLNKDGSGFETLHDFADSVTDGGYPYGTVYETSEGVLYGTTSEGGIFDWGTLYKINRDGSGYTLLRHFNAAEGEGYLPVAPPVEGPGGWLFGTTYFNEPEETGMIYAVRKDGSGLRFLYTFQDNGTDGIEPNATLLRGSDGALYGTTFYGSGSLYGSVFRIRPVVLDGRNSPGGFIVRVAGFTGQRYAVEATESLPPAWNEVASVTNLTGTVEWLDATGADQRFYRARVLEP
jgi:uncharacterized repeat protein (TIGR03803 family)